MKRVYLGVDVGSVSTKLVVIDQQAQVQNSLYLRTEGKPIAAIQSGLTQLLKQLDPSETRLCGVGTTGSGRQLAGIVLGADSIKNEISTHAMAAMAYHPEVSTIIEIGGQDSKLILIKDGVVSDFAMNTVCAAGTGSFLDRQAERLGISITDFGRLALASANPVRIAGRCAVFAESDMIHKQQAGYRLEDIVAGLCLAVARNYLSNLTKGRHLSSPILFQGGVAANIGMVRAFEAELEQQVIVPQHFNVMGAYGAALQAKARIKALNCDTHFRGIDCILSERFQTMSLECTGCANRCELICVLQGEHELARWGGRCEQSSSFYESPPPLQSEGAIS